MERNLDAARRKLFVLHKLPVPYHDDLFRALHTYPGVHLQVYHLWRGSDRRPWKAALGEGYPNHYMQLRCGVDWRTVRDAVRERDALFVVGDWAHLPSWAIVAARKLRRAPVALWLDSPQESAHRPLLKRVLRRAFLKSWVPSVDAVVVASRQAARMLQEHYGVSEDRIVECQLVVDLNWPARMRCRPEVRRRATAWRERIGCAGEGVVFLMSGTIDFSIKAQDVALEAFARAVERSETRLGLLVAGSAPRERVHEEAALRRMIHVLGLGDRVAMLGWLEPNEMASAYLACDVLFHPSHYDRFPLAVVEAMAWGRPVVGTSTSGSVEERVRHGENGFVVPPGDVEAMARALVMAAEPDALTRLSAEARRTAEQWPMERAVETFLQVHDRLVPGTAAPSRSSRGSQG